MKEYKKYYSRVTGVSMVEDSEKMWMALTNRNGICEIDKTTGSVKIRESFAGETLTKKALYGPIGKAGNYLVFSPDRADKIALYDLIHGTILYIPLEKVSKNCKQNSNGPKFWNIIPYCSDVYLTGYSYPAIIKINLESMEVEYITNWLKEVDENIEYGNDRGYFGEGYFIVDESVFIPVSCMRAVLKLDFNTTCTELISVDVPMEGIGGLASTDGEIVWLVGRGKGTNKVCRWQIKTDDMKVYELADEDENIMDPFYAPLCTSSKIFFLPMAASSVYEINLKIDKIKKSEVLQKLFSEVENASLWPYLRIMSPRLQREKLIFLTCDDRLYEYNSVTNEWKSSLIYLEESIEEKKSFFSRAYLESFKESETLSEIDIPLEYFVDRLSSADGMNICKNKLNYFIGEKIYTRLCT